MRNIASSIGWLLEYFSQSRTVFVSFIKEILSTQAVKSSEFNSPLLAAEVSIMLPCRRRECVKLLSKTHDNPRRYPKIVLVIVVNIAEERGEIIDVGYTPG